MIALWHDSFNPLGSTFNFQIEVARDYYFVITTIGNQYFKIAVKHLQTTACLEPEDVLNTGIHNWSDCEHCKYWIPVCAGMT